MRCVDGFVDASEGFGGVVVLGIVDVTDVKDGDDVALLSEGSC